MKRILIFLALMILPFIYTTNALAIDYSDTANHWASTYINELSSKGYLQGYPNGTFLPDRTMTRAEFVSALLRCINISPAYNFSSTNSWADAQINEGIRQGIIVVSEYPQGYNSDGSINRAEAAAMVVRALDIPPNYALASFKDNNLVNASPYAGYIKVAQVEGIITGYPDGEFKPYNYITRAQAAIILSNFLTKANTSSYYDNYAPYYPNSTGINTAPSSTKITTLSLDGYRYNPDYVEVYIDNRPSFYYLSDAQIVSANALRIGGVSYNLSDKNLALKLQGDYYTINQVYWVNNLATLELSKGRQKLSDYWTNLHLSDIEAVYNTNGNKITNIDSLEFRASGKSTYYDLDEIEIDLYDNYIILNNTKYRPNRVEIRVKRNNYSDISWTRIEEIRERNDRLIIDCEYDRWYDDDYYDDYYDDYIDHRDIVFIDEDDNTYKSSEVRINVDYYYPRLSDRDIEIINENRFKYEGKNYNFKNRKIEINDKLYTIDSVSMVKGTLEIYYK